MESRVILAWTGSTKHLDYIIYGLKSAISGKVLLKDVINQFLNSLHREVTDHIAIVVAFESDNVRGNFTVIKGGDILVLENPTIGQYLVAGSGCDHFNNVVSRLDKSAYKITNVSHALALSVNMIASLLEIESIYRQSSPMSYGGAYEICYFDGKCFQKLDNLIIATFVLSINDEECEFYPPNSFVRTHYEGDNLRITALLPGELSTTPYLAVAKPYEDGIDPLPHNLEFRGSHHGYLFRIEWKGEFITNFIEIRIFDDDHPFSIGKVADQKALQVFFGREWFESIIDRAKASITEKYPDVDFS